MSLKFWKASWMDEEHHIFQESVAKFFEAELCPNIIDWRQKGMVSKEFWRKAGDAGLLGAAIPEEYGGAGGDLSYDALILYQLARAGDGGFGWGLSNICAHYILEYGSEAQKQKWLPGIVTGEIIPAIAMTEPGTGSDLQAVKTKADLKDGYYTINGSKIFISNGQLADIVIVVTKTEKDIGAKGISLIVAEVENLEGFRRGRNLDKMGMKGQDTSELFFDNVQVPEENLLGEKHGQGFYQLMSQLAWERLMIGISAIGACDHILDHTIEYVNERTAFGQKLIGFQNTRFKLAEAKTKVEVTRAFIDQCVEKLLRGELDAPTASMAKWWGSEVQCSVADECLQLFGGYGYMNEYPIARAFADARVQKIYGGTNEIQKELVARTMIQ